MANEQNLIPGGHKLTLEEQSNGGKASAAARRARRTLRQAAMSASLLRQAMMGNTKAYEIIRDTIGEKPVEKVMFAEVEQSVIDEVEAAVLGNGQKTSD